LLLWTSKGTVFQFNGALYQQIDGVAMGSPIAPLLADICMNWVIEQSAASTSQAQPTALIRYVDDLFCIFPDTQQLNDFLKHISQVHSNIQFSKELEQCNQLAYLDVLLTRKN